MSTQIQITPKSGITVGTTPITSGTVGRILFEGTGNVLQEDGAISFNQTTKALTLTSTYVATGVPTIQIIGSGINVCPYYRVVSDGNVSEAILVATRTGGASAGGINRAFLSLSNAGGSHNVISSNDGMAFSAEGHTGYSSVNDQMRLKNGNLGIGNGYSATARLDVKAQGALSTDIAFRVRNSADTDNLAYVSGNGLAVIGINASSSPTLIINPSGSARATLRGTSTVGILLNSSGWNNLNGGSGGWDIEATGGEIRQRNGSNYTLLSGNFFGIGRTPSARLDVQAQGATVTDLALRVRNSADTNNLFLVKGNGVLNAPNLPTSAVGLVTGDIWNNLGILTIV